MCGHGSCWVPVPWERLVEWQMPGGRTPDGTPGNPPRLCVTPAPNAPYNHDQEIYVAAVQVPSG